MMGNGSVQTVTLNADNVSRLEIDYGDSGGLTGIEVTCQGTGPGPTAAPTANVSNLTVDPEAQTVAPGTSGVMVGMPVSVSGSGIGAYQIEVGYDNALLTATACTAAAGATCTLDSNITSCSRVIPGAA
jgi:hypothetical protein